MTAFKRVAITLIIAMLASIFITAAQIAIDLIERKADMTTFVQLAVRDALVNIQTTEERGLNYAKENLSDVSKGYQEYLDILCQEAEDETTLALLQDFLQMNQESYEEGGLFRPILFRPIQFGMTYIDKELFKESFVQALKSLIDANYDIKSQTAAANKNEETEGNLFLSTNNAIRIEHTLDMKRYQDLVDTYVDTSGTEFNILFEISDPYIVTLDSSKMNIAQQETYKSLYGMDKIQDYISGLADQHRLGISTTSMPNFFIYYDISVKVYWASTTATPLMNQYFLQNSFGLDDGYFNNGYAEFPGEPIEYSYRYVLLN